jgi:hypothetical protein
MQHHFVVGRISMMAVIFPPAGSGMDFNATAPAAITGTDQGIPKIRPAPVVQAAGIQHFKPLPIQCGKKPPVPQLLLPQCYNLSFRNGRRLFRSQIFQAGQPLFAINACICAYL